MKEELYKIKRPSRIYFCDPWYAEYNEEMLKRIALDMTPPEQFSARLKIYLDSVDGYDVPGITLYLAPEKTIETYASGMKYKGQDVDEHPLCVDTAQYRLAVNDYEEIIYTGGDGYWGSVMEFSRGNGEQKVIDAVTIDISLPDSYRFSDVRDFARRFFGELEPTIGKDAARQVEKPSIRSQLKNTPPLKPNNDDPKKNKNMER